CQLHTKAMLRLKGRITRLMSGLPNPPVKKSESKEQEFKSKVKKSGQKRERMKDEIYSNSG
ncbi:hypothetical protein DRQ05_05555, partial [bacterium]